MEDDNVNIENPDLPVVVEALFDTLSDKDDIVQLSAIESIKTLSRKKPSLVIQTAVSFLELYQKRLQNHNSIVVIKIMTDVCQNLVTPLDETVAISVANLAVETIEAGTDEASDLLVALSKTHCSQAVGALVIKFKPNTRPHYTIIRAIGMIAEKNSTGIFPFIKVALSILESLLLSMHEESFRIAIAFTLGKISDAIHDCPTSTEIVPNAELREDMLYDELLTAFEVLIEWLCTSRNIILIENILITLASILPFLPKDYNYIFILKVIPTLLNLCKKFNARLAASRLLAIILNTVAFHVKELLQPLLEQIHQTLSEMISIAPFDDTRDALLTHYEVLQCFRAIVILYPREGLDRLLQQLKSQNITQRSRSLVVLRHLINTLPAEDHEGLRRIAVNLQDSLGEKTTHHIVGAIVALAARPTLPLLPSQLSSFIKFMVMHSSLETDEGVACEEALHLLSSTVNGAETWLWPLLIKALLDPLNTASAVSILRALAPLAVKIIRDENNLADQKDFQSLKVFGRCLELLESERNQSAVIAFLKCTAPLLGHRLKPQWDTKLTELSKFLNQCAETMTEVEKTQIWEEKIVEFVEESVNLEGEYWGLKLADELMGKTITPSLSIILAAVAREPIHITILVESARMHSVISTGQRPTSSKYARAVGICAKNHLEKVLKIMLGFCNLEDVKKQPVRLLGWIRDTKAATINEATKAGLLMAYAEIAKRGDATALFPTLDMEIFPWIVEQVSSCKEITTKEAALIALEQAGEAIHRNRLPNSPGFYDREHALQILLRLYQSPTGYKPLQLYPLILKAILSLIKLPPALTDKEKEVLLKTTIDKIIPASYQIEEMKMPQVMQQTIEYLGTISSETVANSADTFALLVDILISWMESVSSFNRRNVLLVLRTTLRSYYDSLKYTYPGGKLEPGKLLGMILCWSADPEFALRPLVVDCVALALNIGAKYRSTIPDYNYNYDLNESKRILVSEDTNFLYDGIKSLAAEVSERISGTEIVSLTHGLIKGLLYPSEAKIAAALALSELFKIRGLEFPRSNLDVVVTIINQLSPDNPNCLKKAVAAIKELCIHYPQEILEHLLHQPIPFDCGTMEFWKELGKSDDIGFRALELLLTRLKNDDILIDNISSTDNYTKRSVAAFTSLAAIMAIGQLLSSPKAQDLIDPELAALIAVLIKFLAGWLHVDPPMSSIRTKFGFVPNRGACKINPHKEAYAVLIKVLNIIGLHDANKSTEFSFESESEAEENLVRTMRAVMQCLSKRNDILIDVTRCLENLVTSNLPAQRAVAIVFHAELIGDPIFDVMWLDSIVKMLHEAKADSSPLVRKLATIGLARVALLEPDQPLQEQVEKYLDSCLTSLMNGLEEPANAYGSTEVVLESLKGLAVLLSAKTEKPINPRVVFALKPFIEKENWEMKLAAIRALGSTTQGWQRFTQSPDDDITDHLLGCIPCLVIKLEDDNDSVATESRKVLYSMGHLIQCESLAKIIDTYLAPESNLNFEKFVRELINCLKTDLPLRAEELRNAIVRGYSKSENAMARATSATILGLFGEPRPEDVQRMLQLLHDKDNIVRARAAQSLALSFTF